MADEAPGGSEPASVSGIAVPIALPPDLDHLRRRWDLAASQGAGPHVTVLYPFLPRADLSADVHEELVRIARSVEPFRVRFERARAVHGVVWIEPDPAAPFAALTAAAEARWPGYPAYGGVFDEVIPHLTIAESEAARPEEIEAETNRHLPFEAEASAMELWLREEGRWRPHWRLAFGNGS